MSPELSELLAGLAVALLGYFGGRGHRDRQIAKDPTNSYTRE